MKTNENMTIDNLDMELHLATIEKYRNFIPMPGTWAASIGPDPFAEPGTANVVPF